MSTATDKNRKPAANDPVKLPKKPRPALVNVLLGSVTAASTAMLFLAVPNIVETSGLWGYAKAGVLALGAAAVSYGVNRLAIDHGAPLATTGYFGAGFVSVLSVLAVGLGLFGATYSGLTLKDTAELQLQEHGAALGVHVSDVAAAVSEAGRVAPVMRMIEADLDEKTTCEIATSCISGRGNGGVGPVARAMQDLKARAAAIGEQIVLGDATRQESVVRANAGLAEYQKVLADQDVDVWEQRSRLQLVDGRMRQSVGELRQAVPLSLLSAYAQELQSGVTIAGRPEASARLNVILARHGQTLASVLDTIETIRVEPPAFPKRTGVSDTFLYIPHFLPVAAIAAVVELIFPIALWAYTFWALAWDKYRDEHRRAREEAEANVRPAASAEPAHAAPVHAEQVPADANKYHRRRRHRGNGFDNGARPRA